MAHKDKITVVVNEGKVRGIKKKSNFSGKEYYSFFGIPYGQPPVEHNRFKDPVKVKPWSEILDATEEKQGCRQFSFSDAEILGSEDCLYNNIYTPKIPVKGEPLKPVIVNVHPGGFIFGAPEPRSFGSPDFVMHHDIVYVMIGYRLHILGFLNLGLKECSGNQGLKDIVMSLQWIKKNISVFGGDPNNVTLMGSSSGSAAVHFLMLSPQSKGLFHKAILMGVHVLNPTLITQRENADTAFVIAKSLGYCGADDNKKILLSFLKTISIDAFIALDMKSLYCNSRVPVLPCSPFVPTSDPGENSILPLSPEKLIHSTARVPLMIGFCDREAVMPFMSKKYKDTLANNLYSVITQNPWGWGSDLTNEDLKQIRKKAEQFYLNGESTQTASLSDKCNIITDIALSDVYDSVINIISKDLPSSVFVYRFDFEGSVPKCKDGVDYKIQEPLKGTFHADDYSYWSLTEKYKRKDGYVITPKTREIIEKFTKLISTFAKTGNPNYENLEQEWKPSTIENPCYLRINDELKLIDGKLNGKRMEFWEDLIKKFKKN